MITGFYCTNIASAQAKAMIEYYTQKLGIPLLRTDDDDANGVYLGFIENAPTLCIWDAQKCGMPPTGRQSFVFQTEALDATMEGLKAKGLTMSEAVRYDWGTYEVRLSDPDGNEVVIAELT